MLSTTLLAFALAALAAPDPPAEPPPPAQRELAVPEGKGVLLDGHFSAGEWADAAHLELSGGKTLFAKRDGRYLYFALRFGAQRHSGLDLTLAASPQQRLQLHVSSAIGLRSPEAGGGWSDPAWQPEGWAANAIGTIAGEKGMQVLEPDGFEIQVEASRLPAGALALRWELKRPAWSDPPDPGEGLDGWIGLKR